jgi:hypothetical protein
MFNCPVCKGLRSTSVENIHICNCGFLEIYSRHKDNTYLHIHVISLCRKNNMRCSFISGDIMYFIQGNNAFLSISGHEFISKFEEMVPKQTEFWMTKILTE